MAIRTIHYGIGALGMALVREAAMRGEVQVVGAVDIDPAKVGRALGDVTGDARLAAIPVISPDSAAWPEADVVLHTTASFLADVLPQVNDCIHRGLNVVTSCEEMAFPEPGEALAGLDAHAKEHGVSVLATGVNPGFVMDTLPIVLSAVSCTVESIKVTRVLDARDRRLPFQRKIGAGLTPKEFAAKAEAGGFGHIGLAESARAIAHALGWVPFETEGHLQHLIAPVDVSSPNLSVRRGEVAGLQETLTLRHGGRPVITMHLVMAMGAESPRDEVEIEGDPPVHSIIPGGVHGDRATVGIMLNAARSIVDAPRGFLTMRDLPPLHWRSGRD